MPAVFCSQCGERLSARPRGLWPSRAYCSRCARTFRRRRLRAAAVVVFAAGVGFAIGRLTSSPQPFYFIGTPIGNQPVLELQAPTPDSDRRVDDTTGETSLQTELDLEGTVCGAQTRSGRPCRRAVRFPGPCWQHRQKRSVEPRSEEGNRAP